MATQRGAAYSQSMSPWIWWTIVLGTARIPTQASEVPMAFLIGMWSQFTKSGTMRIPPPTPRSPDIIPAPRPMMPSRHQESRRAAWASTSRLSSEPRLVDHAL